MRRRAIAVVGVDRMHHERRRRTSGRLRAPCFRSSVAPIPPLCSRDPRAGAVLAGALAASGPVRGAPRDRSGGGGQMTTPSRRRTRILVSGVSALLMLVLATQSTLAAVGWTAPVKSAPSNAYNFGKGLARTVSSTSSYLHTQFTYVGTVNPGVYYRRGNSTGSAWGTAKR